MHPDHLDQLAKIQRSGQHLLMLLSDMLDLARIEAGKLELEEQVVSLPLLLSETIDVFTTAAQQKGITLKLVITTHAGADSDTTPSSPQLPPFVQTDSKRLRQVLMNLIGNAVKFTDTGQVICTVSDPPHATAIPQNGPPQRCCLRFSVRDSGIGIEPEELPHLMTPFHQAGDASRRSGGTGLGLAICAELLRKMGSQLQVQSQPGAGSEFWFDLTLTLADIATMY
jgi:signal transduction histidine kinase